MVATGERHVNVSSPVRQLYTHAPLLQKPEPSAAQSRRGRLDAIIVPTSRRGPELAGLIDLAADLRTQLVVLASRQANIGKLAEHIGRHPLAKGIVADLTDYTLPISFGTSSTRFTGANGQRSSDLSVKRNFGLLLARALGWKNVVYIDDDISVSSEGIARLVNQLNSNEVAGKVCRQFPDNSVAFHARRLAKLPQDNFVTGAVLGVACGRRALPFFPDIYNEDWFFFGDLAATRKLVDTGEAYQKPYDPYETPDRARTEEFGDLLAEGLYALIESSGQSFSDVVGHARHGYWEKFIQVRRDELGDIRTRLKGFLSHDNLGDDVPKAIGSLSAADALYTGGHITADICVEFLEELQRDTKTWQDFYLEVSPCRDLAEAVKSLGATTWETVRSPSLSYC
jgi:hypothetical protein